MAPSSGDPRKLRAIKAHDRAVARERLHGPVKPVVVSQVGASLRMRFPDGAVVLGDWNDLLSLANAGVKLVTAEGREVTGLNAIGRRLPR